MLLMIFAFRLDKSFVESFAAKFSAAGLFYSLYVAHL